MCAAALRVTLHLTLLSLRVSLSQGILHHHDLTQEVLLLLGPAWRVIGGGRHLLPGELLKT